jgi:hypothetical protein
MDDGPDIGSIPIPSVWAAVVVLVSAVGVWCLGGAWWASGFLGPLHWFGGFLELLGLVGTIGAIGHLSRTLRWRRSGSSETSGVGRSHARVSDRV